MSASLTTESILRHLANSLPTHTKEDTSSDLSSSYEVIAIFCHACMIASGFRLLGFRQGQTLDECSRLPLRLPPEWNSTFNSYTFIYAHKEPSTKFVIKIDRLGSKAEIRGIGLEDEQINRFEVIARDYVSQSSLPLRIKISPNGDEDRSDLEEKLKDVFISSSRIQDLASTFERAIIRKLVPNLSKDHDESQSSIPTNTDDELNQSQIPQIHQQNHTVEPTAPMIPQPYPIDTCPLSHPYHPFPQGDFPPPGFDDEYDLNRFPTRSPLHPNGPQFNIGYDDLNPQGLGPRDPFRGTLTGGGFRGGMNGMYPTFGEPLFGGADGHCLNSRKPGVPEGARYDPIGPGDMPPGNGRPFNPFDGDKDWDII